MWLNIPRSAEAVKNVWPRFYLGRMYHYRLLPENNYQFNDKQQLDWREEKYYIADSAKWMGFKEDFIYDDANRLLTATGGVSLSMVYSGNKIDSKSDAGTYSYQSGNHRIDELETVAGYAPPEHFLSYTAEGKVDSLTEVTDTATVKLFTFTYGLDNHRFSMKYEVNDTLKYTRYYFGEYEKEVQADGTTRHLNYIYTGSNLIAIFEQNTGGDTMHYVYTDYLGSLRCITDTTGTTEQILSFDAWGNRRNPITGKRDSTVTDGLLFARGYTGHEHLDEVGLINMNGRVYDPMLGMFISVDPYLQAPDFSQSYNRYGYALANPLMYTDPTGEFLLFVIPNISWSPKGGLDIGITAGIGIYKALSAQVTIGYNMGSNNFYAQGGVSAAGFTAYGGWGSQSGWYGGVGWGIGPSGNGLYSNLTSAGINYSQNSGWNFSVSAVQYNHNGGWGFDPSVGYSRTFDNYKQVRVEARNRANTQMALDRANPYSEVNAYLAQYGMEFEEISGSSGEGDPPGRSALASAAPIALSAAAVDGPIPIGDIVGGVIIAGAAAYDLSQRMYVTYTLKNSKGQIYVGRASGFGDPQSVMMRRYAGHEMRAFGYGSPQLDRAAKGYPMGYYAIRGREQDLIEAYGGIGSQRLGNTINGISPYNPNGWMFYRPTSKLYFGIPNPLFLR